MRIVRPARKTLLSSAAVVAGIYVLYLLLGWLALPGILQSQAGRIIEEKSGHHLTMERPEFNPFTLALRIPKLRLEQPDGKPLLTLDELFVDVSASSLFRRAYVLDGIRLGAPAVNVALLKEGGLNWTPLIEALKSKEPEPKTELPRLDIRNFVLNAGRVDFTDEKAGFTTAVEPIDVQLDEVTTVADEDAHYKIAARTGLGAQVSWQGTVDLTPIATRGHIAVEGLDLAKLAPYLKPVLPDPPAGIASLETDYRASYAEGKLGGDVENLKLILKDLRIPSGRGPTLAVAGVNAEGGRFDLASQRAGLARLAVADIAVEWPKGGPSLQKLGTLEVANAGVDLVQRSATVDAVSLKGGQLKAVRAADGRIDLAEAVTKALAPAAPSKKAAEPTPAAKPWRFAVEKVEIANFAAAVKDETTTPPAVIAFEDIEVAADKVSDDLKAPLPVRASFRAAGGGSFKANGQVVPAAPSADLKIDLADLALKPAEPYISAVAKLAVASGNLSVDGRAAYGKQGPSFKGGFALRDLRLDEAGTKNRFLIWKSLASKNVEATPARVDMRDLALEGLDASLLIAKDKSVNLSRILRSDGAAKPGAAADGAQKAAATTPTAPPARTSQTSRASQASQPSQPFVANISRLRIARSELDFADQSLALPFATRIHHLHGVVTNLSTRAGAPGLLEIEGQVDDYGLARAAGQINLFNPTEFADVNVVFRNVEMTRLTPYSATFLGRKITSGKLSLDLQYKFNKRQVSGDNKVVMDKLTLGERVESPEAKNLPLDLAIAILQDSDGRIELGLPVSGSLDDPQFSYGGIVWKAIVNVFTKIATAPFRALASLFGSGEKFDSIAFEAGSPRLTPPEREKLNRVAAIMNKRPGLALAVHGTWSETDRVSLQERAVRRAVSERAGQKLEAGEDAGPVSTQDPKIQSALEGLYIDRLSRADLAALKDGFRKANPGQLPESATGKVMSKLTTLLREPKPLSEDEIAQMRGADFYAVVFERLRAREPMPDDRLAALAQARGQYVAGALKEAGAPMDRLSVGAAEKGDAAGREVPIRLDVETTKR